MSGANHARRLDFVWHQDLFINESNRAVNILSVCADVAVSAVEALIESEALSPVAMAHSAAEQYLGLRRSPEGTVLSSEEALLWYADVCIYCVGLP